MRKEMMMFQLKKGNIYTDSVFCDDVHMVHEYLMHDLIAKKLNCCSYIKSIRRVSNYDGTQNITVTYDNNCRRIYTVKY